jgi:2-phosphosulfolactate phosphatase
LSPVSLAKLPPGYRLVLPSPNGSTLAAESEADVILVACLRNASAVADYLNTRGGDVAIVAAGERWPDGSLRVALEDFIGAGAVVAHWTGRKCIEATAAQAVFERFSNELEGAIRSTVSGQELIERGFEEDVAFAASIDQSNAVPILVDGAFRLDDK